MARGSVTWNGDRYLSGVASTVEQAMGAAALQGEAELKVILSTPGRGRPYPRGSKVHIASAPGDPPAPDTGRLRASSTHEVVRQGDAVIARVSDNTQYALALELGTDKIAARPALRPLLPKFVDAVMAILRVRL
jgi:hypothetical protein